MIRHNSFARRLATSFAVLAFVLSSAVPTPACCPAGRDGQSVVNADQTVIILWDAAAKTQHFIRQASFKSEGDDFGFIVPSPSQPTLAESGNEAFAYLRKLTEPEVIKRKRESGLSCGCSKSEFGAMASADKKDSAVRVLDKKRVAGYDAVVLEATSGDALVDWLKQNGYAYSPEVAAWAKPYIEGNWKFTALKVAKKEGAKEDLNVAAPALRLTFRTDRPLFPYREPDSVAAAKVLSANSRLLRIYFLSDGRYEGELTKESPWRGRAAWSNELTEVDRAKTLEHLQLPGETAVGKWWLTEFEDRWPYAVAPADLYFARAEDQGTLKRTPIIEYVSSPVSSDAVLFGLVGVAVVPWYWRRRRLRK
jgi:hypothetical protein